MTARSGRFTMSGSIAAAGSAAKAVMEAFMEAWHAYTTHPQIAAFVSDMNSRYNIYGDNVNVGFNAQGAMSPMLDPEGKTQQWIVDEYLKFNGRSALDEDAPQIV